MISGGIYLSSFTDHESRGAQRRRQSRAAQALLGSGDTSAVAPPVPIPNTEVKRCSPDGSTATGRARVGRRQNNAHWVYPVGIFLTSCRARPRPKRSSRWESGEIDGQTGKGSRRVNGSERVNRTSPELNPAICNSSSGFASRPIPGRQTSPPVQSSLTSSGMPQSMFFRRSTSGSRSISAGPISSLEIRVPVQIDTSQKFLVTGK